MCKEKKCCLIKSHDNFFFTHLLINLQNLIQTHYCLLPRGGAGILRRVLSQKTDESVLTVQPHPMFLCQKSLKMTAK